jgi:FkbH-like protein
MSARIASAIIDVAVSLDQLLQALDEHPTVAAYTQAARALRARPDGLRPVRIALLATFTIDGLKPYLEVEAARRGFAADVYVAPFDSIKQELLDAGRGCVGHRPDVVFIVQRLADVCPPLTHDFLALDETQRDGHMERTIAEMVASLTAFRRHSRATVVVGNFARALHPPLGLYEVAAPDSQTEVIHDLNRRLGQASRAIAGVHLLDFDKLCADVGYRNSHDDKMWLLGRAPLSAALLPVLARTQALFIQTIQGPPRKCLVLDLDDTLWGGVVGECGVAGIKLGSTYPGNVYREFQLAVLELQRRGILLAITSKNNPADVDEVFDTHPDMVLRKEHFASIRVNWRDKPANLVEIARELNIGVDSLVFFDDNPVERALMRQALPEVLTLEVPADPVRYVRVLRESGAFERLSLTDEDRRRGLMYQEEAARRQLLETSTSLGEFLKSLQVRVSILPVDQFSFPRVLDLLHKTNQFTTTTRRHSSAQLTAMIEDAQCGVFSLRAGDRFGDNGIVGVAIVQAREASAYVDSFLMSCRVIGREIETALLVHLVDWARDRGLRTMEGPFIPTAKNAPAADFYARHGFAREDGASPWTLDLAKVTFNWPDHILRESPEAALPHRST